MEKAQELEEAQICLEEMVNVTEKEMKNQAVARAEENRRIVSRR